MKKQKTRRGFLFYFFVSNVIFLAFGVIFYLLAVFVRGGFFVIDVGGGTGIRFLIVIYLFCSIYLAFFLRSLNELGEI